MTNSKELAVVSDVSGALSVDDVVAQQKRITDVMQKVMKKDHHYGVIQGCNKPSLWKPGAEVLCVTFRLAPSFQVTETYDGKHLTVRSICTLTHIPTGKVFAAAPAICSTKEKKYRIRKEGNKIVENGNLEDSWNTVSKMADKRALVAAVLLATGASDAFTQDMGEDEEKEPLVVVDTEAVVKEPPKEEAKPEPEKPKKNGALEWSGELAKLEEMDLDGGVKAYQVTTDDDLQLKTTDKAFRDFAQKAIEARSEVVIQYKPNKRGTLIVQHFGPQA